MWAAQRLRPLLARASKGGLDGIEPAQGGAAAAPREAFNLVDFVRGMGYAARDFYEHAVRQHSVRCDVLGAGDGFASLPQLTGYRELLTGA